MNRFAAVLIALLCATYAHAQNAITLPYAAQVAADIGNGPVKVRVTQGNASIFTSQGSGVGSTSGPSTSLTLTATPAKPPTVGGLISGTGITSGTTVAAYNGTTGITLSAVATVSASTSLAWGAACPSSAAGIPTQFIQASVTADYYLLYTQARICAISPGGSSNALLTMPVFYDQTASGGGSGITALTGDITASGSGSVSATLAIVNAGVGSFGGVTQCITATVNAKGLITAISAATCTPAVGSVTGFGTGIATALAVNIGSAGAPVLFNGAGGTPSSMTGTNITGIPGAGVAVVGNASGSPSATFGVMKADGTTILCTSGTCSAVSGSGGSSPSQVSKTANYTIANTDCWTTIQAGTGTTGIFTVTLPAVAGFASGCWVIVKNGDTTRGKILSGFPSDLNTILWPQQTLAVQVVNGAWVTVQNPGRWKNPSTVTLCVDTTGSNSNDGLAGSGSGCLADANKAGNIIQKQFDIQQSTPIIAIACAQTQTVQFSIGGQPTGGNLMQISPNGNCSAAWSNAGPCISVGDNAELDLNLTYYGSSGTIAFTCNTANTLGSGHLYLHNYAVIDLEGTPTFAGSGVNDAAIFIDGPGIMTISNGFTVSGTMNYPFVSNAGGKTTLSGVLGQSGSATATGAFFLGGRSFLNLNNTPGAGWGSLGPSKVYSNSTLILNGITVPGGVTVGATGASCSGIYASC